MTAHKPESERHLSLKQHKTNKQNKQTNKSPDDSTETWVWTPSTTQTTQNKQTKQTNKQKPRWQHRNLSLNAIYHSNNTKQTNKQTNKSPDDSTETWVWTPSTTQTTQNKQTNKQTKALMTAQTPESERHLPLKQHKINKQTNKSPDDSTETWVWTPSTTQTTQNKQKHR